MKENVYSSQSECVGKLFPIGNLPFCGFFSKPTRIKNPMKFIMQKVLFLLVLLSASEVATAYDFQVDGLCYNMLSEENKTVEVTYLDIAWGDRNSSYVSGDLQIPRSVTFENVTYEVAAIGENAFWICSGLENVI